MSTVFSMVLEARIKEKQWTKEMELPIIEEFKNSKLYHFDPKSRKPVFTIDTPPPYPSGTWHIGAVAHYSLIDMIARSRRMLGFNVLFPWGVDRNGINIELLVEKKHGKVLHEWDREEFIRLCSQEIEAYTHDLEKIARRVALSPDYENAYYTDSPAYRAASQAAFIDLWNKGLIVEELRPNTYCPACGTTVADAEVYYKDSEAVLVHVRWKTETGEELIIATTRPELMCACRVVLVNPDDERYKKLHGIKTEIPLYGSKVEIRAHPYVDPKYGSGAMMICSYGDTGDVQLFRELGLVPVAAIDTNWKMTEVAGPYQGLPVKEARAKIVEDLKAKGLVVKEQRVSHKLPICERSKTPVEIINLKEWYVRQTHVLKDLKKIAKEMRFYPEKNRQLLLDWIDNITIDWPVSRRRYYHTEIPIWYCVACAHAHVPEPGPYYQPWKQKAPFKKCACGSTEFVGEKRVFDTWMDSSISNLYIIGYPKENKKMFPVSLRPQGRDIVRTWLYYTMLKSYLLKKEKAFENVWITGMGLDQHGKKMSKSLGNIIHPDDVLDKYGADAFRLWAAAETSIGDDYRISEERMEAAFKTLQKLWNVAKFISQFSAFRTESEISGSKSRKPKKQPRLSALDAWIVHGLNGIVETAREAHEEFNFQPAVIAQRHFLWETFASHYLELVKPRAYNEHGAFTQEEQDAARWTLNYVLDTLLLLWAPITPMITYKLYKELRGRDVHAEEFPEALKGVGEPEFTTSQLVELNGAIWKFKKDKGLSLKAPLEKATLPKAFVALERDLKAAHNIGTMEWGGTLVL